MIIGVPREIKNREYRVACTPGLARLLAGDGHEVRVETGAGAGSGFADEQYREAGARIVETAKEAWDTELVLKVKEPQEEEYAFLRNGLIVFGYFHLAAGRALTEKLMQSGVTALALEMVRDKGRLPLLEPMSEIAGRMSAIVGAFYLSRAQGGSGVLPSGAPGVAPGHVAVLGGGTAGVNAARIAVGLGAEATLFEIDPARLRDLEAGFGGRARTLYSSEQNLLEWLPSVDLLIGAVLIPGARAPKLVTRAMLRSMRAGSVAVDIAIDQGGCLETSRPTTHDAPVFEDEGVLHYCVTNMPAAYARTATLALTSATAPYVRSLAKLGIDTALSKNPGFAEALNTRGGKLVARAVAEAHRIK